MVIAIALPGIIDLVRAVTPYFSLQKQILFTIVYTLSKIEQKSMWEVKKNQYFCPRDIESCHLAAAMRAKSSMVAKYELVR